MAAIRPTARPRWIRIRSRRSGRMLGPHRDHICSSRKHHCRRTGHNAGNKSKPQFYYFRRNGMESQDPKNQKALTDEELAQAAGGVEPGGIIAPRGDGSVHWDDVVDTSGAGMPVMGQQHRDDVINPASESPA